MTNPNDLSSPVIITTTNESGHGIQTVMGGFTKREVVRYLFMAAIAETSKTHNAEAIALKANELADAYFANE